MPKATCLSSTLDAIESLNEIRCPGVSAHHKHGTALGKDEQGHWASRRLQTYPPRLALRIAELIFQTLSRFHEDGTGPTGHMHGEANTARTTAFGSQNNDSTNPCVSLLNEDVIVKRQILLHKFQTAAYLHVDDSVSFSIASDAAVHADELMVEIANGLEEAGFLVPERYTDIQLDKVVGYSCSRRLARFHLPANKWTLLRQALLDEVQCERVDVGLLHSLLGLWLFGALLRRDLLAIPFMIFKFIEHFEKGRHYWWASARSEALAMALSTPFMYYDAGAKLAPFAMASDAMGASTDNGGYGLAIRELPRDLLYNFIAVGLMPGRTIARLSDTAGLKNPFKQIKATKPLSSLAPAWLDVQAWKPLSKGRWKAADHITLGEARSMYKVCQIMSVCPECRNFKVISLQDNWAVSGSHSKGRSTSWPLNFIHRKKTALLLSMSSRLMLPWIETSKQVADYLSRILSR